MSARAKPPLALVDGEARREAVSTFDRTVVVTAGAGTGKTALLTGRILAILMHPGEAAAGITEIAAITFTRRAAGEMRVRIREALLSFVVWAGGQPPEDAADPLTAAYIAALEGLSAKEVRARALLALEELERAPISTMHSFAGQLLREHPGAARIDPGFTEDDGTEFEKHFSASWRRFLSIELGANPPQAQRWNVALDAVSLERLAGLARMLAEESIDLDALEAQLKSGELFTPDVKWLEELRAEAAGLWQVHDRSTRLNPGKILGAAVGALEVLIAGQGEVSAEARELLEKKAGSGKAWPAAHVAIIKRVARVVHDILGLDVGALRAALEVLLPFARGFREEFARAGFLGFSALLMRARDLLRDHPDIRERVKRRCRHVLVDEFQDTDPLQYEIVYFLCEVRGGKAKNWQQLELEPGKLFIVGDPKQSIYSFRGADIGAYGRTVDESLAKRSLRLRLETNFRSRDRVLDAINGLFAKIIREQALIQPEYQPLSARPGGEAVLPAQRVELRIARRSGGKSFDYASEAVRGEARSLAHWLRTEVIGCAEIDPGRGGKRKVAARDVAVLLRTMTRVDEYVDALRAEGIPLVVEGQKSFFVTEEVRAFINLLSAVVDPGDSMALAGVLRSPLGALTDRDLALLARDGALDVSRRESLPADLTDPGALADLYAVIEELHLGVAELSLPAAIDLMLRRLPVLEAAVATGGEGAAGNIEKVRRLAVEHGLDGDVGLREFARMLRRNAAELVDEGENPLAEEGQDAVRVLTIHKAKGLEFPVVILAGLQAGIRPQDQKVRSCSDWTTGRWGLVLGDIRTPSAVRHDCGEDLRRDAEERRVFYVGATRAREMLVLSAAPTSRRSAGRYCPLDFLAEVIDIGSEDAELSAGEGRVHLVNVEVVAGDSGPSRATVKPPPAATLREWAALDAARAQRCSAALSTRLMLRPSAVHDRREVEDEVIEGETLMPLVGRRREGALLLGTLAHAVMERLDFASAAGNLAPTVAAVLAAHSVELVEGREELAAELCGMLGKFIASQAFVALQDAKILARELPCLLPWKEPGTDAPVAAAEGIIDLVYESGGELAIADYKTDSNLTAKTAKQHAEQYRPQGAIYAQAVRAATGREVSTFRVVFLRTCLSVDLEV
jgi:ATP-dependent helicase/nuclease subunit A